MSLRVLVWHLAQSIHDKPKENPMTSVLVTGMTTNRGGVESLVYNYVSRLADSIHFEFWCSNEHCAYEEELVALGCVVRHGTAYGSDPIRARRDTQSFFAENAGRYDALWSNKSMLVNIDDLRFAKRYELPRIILHSHNSQGMFSGPMGVVKSTLHRAHRHAANELATDYWACSRGAANYFFTKANIDGPHYSFIPNAIDMRKFMFNPAIRTKKRVELGIADTTTVIGFVGRLEYQKDPELLIRIFIAYHADNPDSILLVVGTGSLLSRCEDIASQAGIHQSVLFLGSRTDIAELYQAMDAFCLPSRFEGLPVVLIEAQAAGLPCFISEAITDEAQVTPLCKRVDSRTNTQEWANKMLSTTLTPINRSDGGDKDVESNLHSCFDIVQSQKLVEASLKVKRTHNF